MLLKVSGSNPWKVSFEDPNWPLSGPAVPQQYVVKKWRVRKVAGSECLKVAVTWNPADLVSLPFPGPAGPSGVATLQRRLVPQAVEIRVDCGTCTCGGAFAVEVTAGVYPRSAVAIAFNWTLPQLLTIHCAGPDCCNDVTIDGVVLPQPSESEPQ